MKRIVFLVILGFAALQANAQSEYELTMMGVEDWYDRIQPDMLQKGSKEKTIDFTGHSYSIRGYFLKGALVEGQIATIYDTQNTQRELLRGKVKYISDCLYISGVKYEYDRNKISRTFGTFHVFNNEEKLMQYSPKKAGPLGCDITELQYFLSEYDSRPVIISAGKNQYICIGDDSIDETFPFIDASLPANTVTTDNYSTLAHFLPLIKEPEIVQFANGSTFKGIIKVSINRDGHLSFERQLGKHNYPSGDIASIAVNQNRNDIVMTIVYRNPKKNITKEVLSVPANNSLIDSELWNKEYYYSHLSSIGYDYIDGSKYSGSAIVDVSKDPANPEVKLTYGTFYYPNGDYFIGDVSGQRNAGYFIDGDTILKSGETYYGDFLSHYYLTPSQIFSLESAGGPSQAIKRAKDFEHSNIYTDYRYKDSNFWSTQELYFDPDLGFCTEKTGIVGVSLNKETGFYSFRNKNDDVVLEAMVDNSGHHTVEITYNSSFEPEYIIEITTYPDGRTEKVKSFHYDTKELYIVCNYFSDGSLRSAYQYRYNDEGEPTLVRSKESHPSVPDMYSCKLYDYNGNFERSIIWKIGESSASLFDIGGVVKVSTPVFKLSNYVRGRFDYKK